MIDVHMLRKNADLVRTALSKRRFDDVDRLISLEEAYRNQLSELEELSQARNKASEDIARMKKSGEDASALMSEMKSVSAKISSLKKAVEEAEGEFKELLLRTPNLPSEDTPDGDESNNRIEKEWGEERSMEFEPKTHLELGESLNMLDFERAAKLSGSSFILFKGVGAKLERALIQFMLDVHTEEHDYEEVSPPFMVKRHCMEGTGQLPKFEDDMYRIYRGSYEDEQKSAQDSDMFLVPTAEVPVTNIHRKEILNEEDLPIAYCAYTPCFRLEAGAYGKDTKGMMRVHQFDKVELVRLCRQEDEIEEHEKLLSHAEKIFQMLGLKYRVVVLAAGDLGFSASKCYDIEVWAPGMKQWLEASSCSRFGDFQSRRMQIRYKGQSASKPTLVRTLNGSGVALARTFIALVETYQNADGTISIPDCLKPYMAGKDLIKA